MGRLAPPGTVAYDERVATATLCDACGAARAVHVTTHDSGQLGWCGHCYVKHQPG